MQLQAPLHSVADNVDSDVLYCLARVEAELTVAELRSVIGRRSLEGIRRSLDRLVLQGVVAQRRVGRTNSYSLNRDHLAAPAIIALSEINSTLKSRIVERIATWEERPTFVAMFGSSARGEMRPDSDIDLVFVRDGAATPMWDQQISDLMREIAAWTGNDGRPLILERAEIQGRGADEPVLRDIANDGVPLFGERSEFRRLIGVR